MMIHVGHACLCHRAVACHNRHKCVVVGPLNEPTNWAHLGKVRAAAASQAVGIESESHYQIIREKVINNGCTGKSNRFLLLAIAVAVAVVSDCICMHFC